MRSFTAARQGHNPRASVHGTNHASDVAKALEYQRGPAGRLRTHVDRRRYLTDGQRSFVEAFEQWTKARTQAVMAGFRQSHREP